MACVASDARRRKRDIPANRRVTMSPKNQKILFKIYLCFEKRLTTDIMHAMHAYINAGSFEVATLEISAC
jgi:hypothetical protein